MKVSELLNKDCVVSGSEFLNEEISDVCDKSEEIEPGCLFILNESVNCTNEEIAEKTRRKNPRIIVCSEKMSKFFADFKTITVSDTRAATSEIYSKYYRINYDKLVFIGVTGTNGKTTTATLIKNILDFNEKKTGFIGTGKIIIGDKKINDGYYSMTTPDPKALYKYIKEMENAGCEYIVMEVSSHSLYLEKVAPIKFKIGIFTNLSSEHLDFHKNIDEYYRAKKKLFDLCEIGIFNADDIYSMQAYNDFKGEKYCVGAIKSADVYARNVTVNGLYGVDYFYREKNFSFKAKLKIPGVYNVYNSMLAIKAAILLGICPCDAKKGVNATENIEGRFEIICQKPMIIIDYAHTEKAMESILKTINLNKKTEQKLICVFGCGGERDVSKRDKMGACAEKYSDSVIVTGDNPRNEDPEKIINDILKGIRFKEKVKVINDRKEALIYAASTAGKNDIVCVLGKGHEKYIINASGYTFFDEKEILLNALKNKDLVSICE